MPDEAQLPSGEPTVRQHLLWRVRVFTVVCLGLSLTPAGFVATFGGGPGKWSDAAIELLFFSPVWVPLLAVLLLLWNNKQERALGIAIGVGSAGFFLASCFLAVLFLLGRTAGDLGIPIACMAGVLGIFAALRLSAQAAGNALSSPDTGTNAGPRERTPGGDAPLARVPPKKMRRRETSWLTLFIGGMISGAVLYVLLPNYPGHPVASNEASAVGSLRTINTACVTYSSTYEKVGFPPALENLGPREQGPPSENRADLIDQVLAGGIKSGYGFRYTAGPRVDGMITTYTVNADPIVRGEMGGVRHFFTDQTGVLRFDADKPASASSTPFH